MDRLENLLSRIREEYLSFIQTLGFNDLQFIPMSALKGDNVAEGSKAMPWYPVDKPRFHRELTSRPPGVRPSTDVQVEIVDGRGGRTRLDDRWIEWK